MQAPQVDRIGSRRVLFLEFNEITRTVIDPLIAQGKLPNFQRLFREGAVAAPESNDLPPHLDPWVTWVTVHTGVDRDTHGATVLEQDASTIRAKRTWEYIAEAGKSVGVFGSISAHPPKPVNGFMVPGPFAPTSATYPVSLEPVQALNRQYTGVHGKRGSADSPLGMAIKGTKLLRLGLKPQTCARVAAELVRERAQRHLHWRRVALQPLINYDFFAALYRRYRPDFATWHTNHAAHYMHHYWRAWDDSGFLTRASDDEKRKFGDAIEHGYRICDELLGRFLRLVDDDTVIVLASSMGQQPYVSKRFPEGRVAVRVRDIDALLRLVGARGVTEAVPTMVPQWNLKVPDAAERGRLLKVFTNAYTVGASRPSAFGVTETEEILTITPLGVSVRDEVVRYFFPDVPDANPEGYPLEELFVRDTPTPKQGVHHPTGLLVLHGKGIRPGVIPDTTNLDIAPTLFALLGVPVPDVMKGRVLEEAWGGGTAPMRAAH